MKIFLPFELQDIGGPSTFARQLQEGLGRRGHIVYFEHPNDYDVLFVIVSCRLKYLFEAKIKGKKIVQRLDGVYYQRTTGWKYWLLNLKMKLIYNWFADVVVYQSKFSKLCSEKYLGKTRSRRKVLIYNGVNLNKFYPTAKLIDNKEKRNVLMTVAAFRRKEQIVPLLEAVKVYEKKNKNFVFKVVGSFTKEVQDVPAIYSDYRCIKFLGKVDNSKLPELERSSDVFLFSDQSACPNTVLEAMSSGLPICSVDIGAMPEFVKQGVNGYLAKSGGSEFISEIKYPVEEISSNLEKILSKRDKLGKASRKTCCEKFDIEKMYDKYASLLDNIY